ncbi:MAG: NAD-dependent epimerase/dehydratase family protein [Actinomycetota bacterium]|nr:NAD-dependent epimerase/dehydratase family protein [Actinomycetota bacterium]
MRAFVTGGAGFIGSNLVDRLLAEGHAVDVVDNLSTGSLASLSAARRDPDHEFSFQRLDVNSTAVAEIMARRQPDVVYHLAAGGGAAASVRDPVLDAEVNILGSLRVVEAARQAGARKVVFATSGAAIYGEPGPGGLPVKESSGHRPMSPHGVAKSSVAGYLAIYRELHNLEYTALALASVYGPGQSPTAASGVVAILAGDLIAGRPGTIHGDGSQTRDFVYVDDVVDALVRAAERGSGLTLNIGTGVETSIRSLHVQLAAAAGVTAAPVYGPPRPGEVIRFSLNPGRAAIHLGWTPWTTLPAGVAATVEWVRTAGT